MIWHEEITAEQVQAMSKNTLMETMKITIDKVESDCLIGSMPVNKTTHQPFGILHGGANCVLAETLGSYGANLTLDSKQFHAVGLNINTNHLKAVRNGRVKGEARPVHLGKTTQLWNIKTFNESGDLTSETQLTMMVLKRKL